MIIYNNFWQIPAISRDQLSYVSTARNRTQLFYTSACRLPSGREAKLLRPPPVAFSSSPSPSVRLFQLSDPLFQPAANNEAHVRSPLRTRAAHPFSRPFLRLSLFHSLTPSVFCPTLSHTHKRVRNACTCSDTLNDVRPFYSPRSVPPPARPPLSSWFHSFAQKSNFHGNRGDVAGGRYWWRWEGGREGSARQLPYDDYGVNRKKGQTPI